MELDDLKKQLYGKKGEAGGRPQPLKGFSMGQASLGEHREREAPPQWTSEPVKPFFPSIKQKRRIFWWSIIFVLVVGASLGGIYWRFSHFFDKAGVALDIFGVERAISGEAINYVVRVKNNARVDLRSVKLDFLFPIDSVLADGGEARKWGDWNLAAKDIGDLAAGQESQTVFRVRVLGEKDAPQKFLAKLSYRPANVSMEFVNEKDFVSVVVAAPLVLSFVLPEKIVSGQTLDFSLKYINTSDVVFGGSRLKIDYPDGFIFENAAPSPSVENNVWDLPETGGGEEGKIILRGAISGNEGDSKVFRAQIGLAQNGGFAVLAQTLSSPQITVSPLSVELILANVADNMADLGQFLDYRLKYGNTTNAAIGPVVIAVKIDSRAVDWSSVVAPKGFFNSADNVITWNASSWPNLEKLAGGATGELNFSFRVKGKLPVVSSVDKNFVIIVSAQIDSPNTPLSLTGTSLTGRNQLSVKVSSRLVLSARGYYGDSLLPNNGPLPPRVGQETTYTVYWELFNVSNELTDIVVEAFLPSYVRWKGKFYPLTEDIKYDEAAGKLVWKIKRLSAGTGVILPVRQVAFQVGFTPSLSQVGDLAVIVKEARAVGRDSFTEREVSAAIAELKSDMPNDAMAGFEKGRVQN